MNESIIGNKFETQEEIVKRKREAENCILVALRSNPSLSLAEIKAITNLGSQALLQAVVALVKKNEITEKHGFYVAKEEW